MTMTQNNEAMEVGTKLVELCQAGENMKAIETLYDANIVSVEACGMEGMDQEMRGVDAIKGKNEWWYANNEVHSSTVEGPYPHGNRFVLMFNIDCTPKEGPMAGQRMQFAEAGLYTVEGGKIVREEFFYAMD